MTQEPFLVRISRQWGWRAYAIPVLVVLTVFILIDVFKSEEVDFGSDNSVVAEDGDFIGPVPGAGFQGFYEKGQLPEGPDFETKSSGEFDDVTVAHPRVGEGKAKQVTYSVEIENNIDVASIGGAGAFPATVNAILSDPRGWTANPMYSFEAVPLSKKPTLIVQLATTDTAHELCGNTLELETSCRLAGKSEADPSRVIVNIARWVRGALPFEGDLGLYRQYLINHEVGHALGYRSHEQCTTDGAMAPIMMQQTLSLSNDELYELNPDEVYRADGKVCTVNGWPYPFGADATDFAPTQKARS